MNARIADSAIDAAHRMIANAEEFLADVDCALLATRRRAEKVVADYKQAVSDYEEFEIEGRTERYGTTRPPVFKLTTFTRDMHELGFRRRAAYWWWEPAKPVDLEVNPRFKLTKERNAQIVAWQMQSADQSWLARMFIRAQRAQPAETVHAVAEKFARVHSVN